MKIRGLTMKTVVLEYCTDGFNLKREKIKSFNFLKERLEEIKNEADSVINGIFSVDIVIEETGRIAVALSDKCILMYTSHDLEITFISLGDESAQGLTTYYFGDYSDTSNKYIITYDVALDVLKEWVHHGVISDLIKWTTNLY